MSEYRKFLEAEYVNRKLSLYEKLCNFFDKVKIPLPKDLEKRIQDEINFCHLRVTPNGVILATIFTSLIIFLFLTLVSYFIGILSLTMVLMFALLSSIIFYFLFSYTSFLTKYFRAKVASEMTLAIVYMSISLKINASLEAAVAFAASNLSGPLGLDLKKILWDLETGRLLSIIQGLDELSEKWKSENEEFVDAISLLKSATSEISEKTDKTIREAVNIMAEGTKSRMKKYAMQMRNPLRLLNAFGILLPMLGLIFFPILIIFIPEIAKLELLAFSYMILLPSVVYLFLRQYFLAKPYSYHQVQIKNLEEFKKQKKIAIILSLFIALFPSFYFLYKLFAFTSMFSLEQFLYSYLVVLFLAISIITYSLVSVFNNLKKNEEILRIESELPVAMFQLSIASNISKPIEKNIEDLLTRIRTLKISELFKKILYNITIFGMSLESAIFEEKIGAIHSYPSKIISSTFKLLVEVSRQGVVFLSMALKTISEFLKDANEVNKATEEILSESTSDMQIQAWVFAPLSAGIVVGLMAIIIYIFSFFGENFAQIQNFLGGGTIGEVTTSSFSFLFNIGKQIPFHYFQLIVGIYMIEMVVIISHFLGELNYGDDEVNKILTLGKIMTIAILIYSLTTLSIYFGVTSFMQLPEVFV
jgi:Flp pilus assembly protein TadB